MARKNSVVSATVSPELIVIAVNDSETGFNDSIAIDVPALASEITERAMLHGLVQKISDAAALGKGATASDKFAAMKAVADRLIDGEWKASRGEGNGTVAGVIFRAFSQWAMERAKAAKKPTPNADKLRAVYDAKTRSEQLALRNVPEIAAIIETLKAVKPAKAVDTDALLSDLGL